jgi:alpha-galactosidase
VFQVFADGTKLYDSGLMTGSTATKDINVSISGKNELRLVVYHSGDGNGSDHADWGSARISCGTIQQRAQYLSDLSWTSAQNGWGPVEKDKSNGETAPNDGAPITLNGVVYQKGLGVHSSSDVLYKLGGACSTFKTSIGVDDEVHAGGSIVFQVFADGAKLADSGVMTGSTATKSWSLDVTGKQELRLVVTDGGDGNGADHGSWADAQIICNI